MSKEEGKGRNCVPFGFKYCCNISKLTGVVAALECCDRRWLFLGKEGRSKNEELNVTGICNRQMKNE